MGSSSFFVKDPDAVLDYSLDWASWLGADTIASSTWTLPAGIVKFSETFTTTTTTIWLSGGTVGTDYEVVNRIQTAALRIEDRTLTIRVRER